MTLKTKNKINNFLLLNYLNYGTYKHDISDLRSRGDNF